MSRRSTSRTYTLNRSLSESPGNERSAFHPLSIRVSGPTDLIDRVPPILRALNMTAAPDQAAPVMEVHVSWASAPPPRSEAPWLKDDHARIWKEANRRVWRYADYDLSVPTSSDEPVEVTLYSTDTTREAVRKSSGETRRPSSLLAYALRDAVLKRLPDVGWLPLHGAALAFPDADTSPEPAPGVLLVGSSGTGKSTLAASLAQQGYRCASDDLLVMRSQRDGEGQAVTSMTRGIRLCPDAYERLEGLETKAAPSKGLYHDPTRPKYVVRGLQSDASVPTIRPTALVFPSITKAPRSRLVRVPPALALTTMLAQMTPPRLLTESLASVQLSRISELIRSTPAYRLDAGRDMYAGPENCAVLFSGIHASRTA